MANITTPEFEAFAKQFEECSVVPLSVKLILDGSPLSLLANFRPESFVCLMESLGSVDKPDARRWTILGLDPKVTFSFDGQNVTQQWKGEDPKVEPAEGITKGIIRQIDDFLGSFHSVYDDSMPLSNGGLIGYVSRDLLFVNGKRTTTPTEQPLAYFVVPQTFIIFDGFHQTYTVLVNAFAHDQKSIEAKYTETKAILDAHVARLHKREFPQKSPIFEPFPTPTTDEPDVELNDLAKLLTTEADRKDITTMYLNRTLRETTSADPVSVYRVFRSVYPSEYTYIFRVKDSFYIGSHEEAKVDASLSFANLIRHALRDTNFTGAPCEAACELRKARSLHYGHDSAVFGYIGFNGHYKISQGNKELVLAPHKDGFEAIFSRSQRASWKRKKEPQEKTMRLLPETTEGFRTPTSELTVVNTGSISAAIRQILLVAAKADAKP